MTGQTDNLDADLVTALLGLEAAMGFALTITSGHRDAAHNAAVGGVPGSEHTSDPAKGVDILCKQSITRFKMLKWLLAHDIRRIGIGKDFVHVGLAEEKPQFVVWTYYA